MNESMIAPDFAAATECAVVYGRVSQNEQDLDTQDFHLARYLVFKSFTVAETFMEKVSGWDHPLVSQRREGARLMAYLLAHPEVRHVCVLKVDRIGRRAKEILVFAEWLESHHLFLHIANMGGESMSSQGPWGKFMFHLLAGLAELEVGQIRERIIDKLEKKRHGGELCGTVSYGWDAIATGQFSPKGVALRTVVDNLAEQAQIRHMQMLRAAGYSYKAIATDLNTRQIPSKNAGKPCRGKGGVVFTASGRWGAGQVERVLNSRMVRDWTAQQQQLQQAA